jgi:hypothetical protein
MVFEGVVGSGGIAQAAAEGAGVAVVFGRDGAPAPSVSSRVRTGPKVACAPRKSVKKLKIGCPFVGRSQKAQLMQPRQSARVRQIGKISSAAKLIVGRTVPVIDCCIVTCFTGAPASNYGDSGMAQNLLASD